MRSVVGRSARSLDGMLGRIREWWRAKWEWRRAHKLAFAEVATTDAEGVTSFQRRLVSAVQSTVLPDSFNRVVAQNGEIYFVAPIPETSMQLFVYANGAELTGAPTRGRSSREGRSYEEWDFRTPDELINSVVEDLRKAHAV